MITIPVRGRVKPDGTLVVSLATGMPESEVEVLVVVNPLSSGGCTTPKLRIQRERLFFWLILRRYVP